MELAEIAQKIKNSNKKVTLLYAFNATGKTRLSMEFKNLVNEIRDDEVIKHVVYYNAFTEDLFSWIMIWKMTMRENLKSIRTPVLLN